MDDFTRIKGIGPAAAKRLVDAGITTFEQLAHDAVAGEHGVQVAWISEAAVLISAQSTISDDADSSEKERSGTAREAPSTNEEREAQASDAGVQPAAPNNPGPDHEKEGAAVPPDQSLATRAAWLALQELGEEEARGRFPRAIVALQAWAEQTGSRAAIEAGPTVRIAARREGFRRCGIAHPKAAADHPAERFSPDELEQLLAEPNLSVELV